jgi:hypothetical protein
LSVSSVDVSSAEWIAEAPSSCTRSCQTLPLANFGTVPFSAASATATNGQVGTIAATPWSAVAITLGARTGSYGATPSALSADGSSFTVATAQVATTSVTVPTTRSRRPWWWRPARGR